MRLYKYAKFLMSFLKAQVSFPSNFASILCAIKHNSSVTFLARAYTLVTKRPLKHKFQVLGSKFIKFIMSFLKRQVNFSPIFVSFFIVMTHNSSVNFKLIFFLLWIKGSHQCPYFETFKCSSENLPNFSCHFPNQKPVFL